MSIGLVNKTFRSANIFDHPLRLGTFLESAAIFA